MKSMETYDLHRVAYLFPEMDDGQFKALKADILEHGQHQPILTFNGLVVDGRHRLKACRELGIAPVFKEIASTEQELLSRVLSENLHRRHMTQSQVAMVVAMATRDVDPAGGRPNKTRENSLVSSQPTKTALSKAAGVHETYTRKAAKVLRHDERLAKQVADGECSLEWAVQKVNIAQSTANGGTTREAKEIIRQKEQEQEYGADNIRWEGYTASAKAETKRVRLFLEKHLPSFRPVAPTEQALADEREILEAVTVAATLAAERLTPGNMYSGDSGELVRAKAASVESGSKIADLEAKIAKLETDRDEFRSHVKYFQEKLHEKTAEAIELKKRLAELSKPAVAPVPRTAAQQALELDAVAFAKTLAEDPSNKEQSVTIVAESAEDWKLAAAEYQQLAEFFKAQAYQTAAQLAKERQETCQFRGRLEAMESDSVQQSVTV